MPDLVQVKQGFSYDNTVMREGDIVTTEHPAYKGREDLFYTEDEIRQKAISISNAATVQSLSDDSRINRRRRKVTETTTSRPGELRETSDTTTRNRIRNK